MITYGYSKGYRYSSDGSFFIRVRIPSIHGPYSQTDSNGLTIRGYVRDEDLPWYRSILLTRTPNEGDVVMLSSINESQSSDFVVIGLTGGKYQS